MCSVEFTQVQSNSKHPYPSPHLYAHCVKAQLSADNSSRSSSLHSKAASLTLMTGSCWLTGGTARRSFPQKFAIRLWLRFQASERRAGRLAAVMKVCEEMRKVISLWGRMEMTKRY